MKCSLIPQTNLCFPWEFDLSRFNCTVVLKFNISYDKYKIPYMNNVVYKLIAKCSTYLLDILYPKFCNNLFSDDLPQGREISWQSSPSQCTLSAPWRKNNNISVKHWGSRGVPEACLWPWPNTWYLEHDKFNCKW